MVIDKLLKYIQPIFDKITNFFSQKVRSNFKYIVFFIGVTLFLSARLYYVVNVNINTTVLPGGPDDAYGYVLTGVQTETCFFQDCIALEDLREQILNPTDNLNLAQERLRQYHRVFSYFHPLHSLIFVGINSILSSLELTYKVMVVIGAILINAGICYWIYSIWGPAPGGITLGLLAFVIESSSDLLDVDPSDFATGVAIISWGLILKNSKYKYWAIPVCVLVMGGMHSIGQIFSVVTIALYLLMMKWPAEKKDVVLIGSSTTIFLIYFFFLPLIHRPEFGQFNPSFFYTEEFDYIEILRGNIKVAYQSILWWGNTSWVRVSAGLLILIGLVNATQETRKKAFVMGGLLVGLFVISIFYLVPWYPGIITVRVWIPLILVLFGAIGQVLWFFGKSIIDEPLNNKKKESLVTPVAIFTAIILSFFIYQTFTTNEWVNGETYKLHRERILANTVNYWLDQSQPELMLSIKEENDVVLYMEEMPLYFFLSNGALETKAVYYPTIANSPEQLKWIDENGDIRFLVTMNPINALSPQANGAAPLFNCTHIIINSETQFDLSEVSILVKNLGEGDYFLKIEYMDVDGIYGKQKINIHANSSLWLSDFEGIGTWVKQITLHCTKEDQKIFLGGIRFSEDATLNWPWDQGITLTREISPKSGKEEISFNSTLLTGKLDFLLKVIADDGVTVLAEVEK